MAKSSPCKRVGSLIAVAAMIAFAGINTAQEKKVHEKHDASMLYNSLRDVINQGAKLFNDQGDHAGCYRLYQGSLLSVRPFLAPDLQKKIETSMAGAERKQSFAERAFDLRRVLDEVRAQVKPITPMTEEKKIDDKRKEETKVEEKKVDEKKKEAKKVEEKKKEETKVDEKKKAEKKVDDQKKDETKLDEKNKVEKKADEKKKDETKVEEKKSAGTTGEQAQVTGTIRLEGKAVSGGHFVTLVSGEGRKFSSTIQKDGSFRFKTPIPIGDYRIVIEPIPDESLASSNVPARYRGEATSGLSVHVDSGPQNLDLKLSN